MNTLEVITIVKNVDHFRLETANHLCYNENIKGKAREVAYP